MVVLLESDYSVRSNDNRVVYEDAEFVVKFNAAGKIRRFAHRVNLHRARVACNGASAARHTVSLLQQSTSHSIGALCQWRFRSARTRSPTASAATRPLRTFSCSKRSSAALGRKRLPLGQHPLCHSLGRFHERAHFAHGPQVRLVALLKHRFAMRLAHLHNRSECRRMKCRMTCAAKRSACHCLHGECCLIVVVPLSAISRPAGLARSEKQLAPQARQPRLVNR